MAAPETEIVGILRAYSRALTSNKPAAESLVEETLREALSIPRDQLERADLIFCLLRIMRASFVGDLYDRPEHIQDPPYAHSSQCGTDAYAVSSTAVSRVEAALYSLPLELREAVVLTVMLRQSEEAAASIMGCKVDTLKGRVTRGRDLLERHLAKTA